jgi:hypothetical protein
MTATDFGHRDSFVCVDCVRVQLVGSTYVALRSTER